MFSFDPAALLPNFRFSDTVIAISAGQNLVVAPANAARVWILLRTTTTTSWLRIGSRAQANGGINLNNTTPLIFSYSESGLVPSLEFNVFENTTLNPFYVATVSYVP